MKKILCAAAMAAICNSLAAQTTISVNVSNPMSEPRTDVPVVIKLNSYGDVRSALVTQGGKEIACQLDDLNQDETFDELCFLADLDKKEQKQYTVIFFPEGEPRPYPARVYAEMVMANTKDKTLKKNEQKIGRASCRERV